MKNIIIFGSIDSGKKNDPKLIADSLLNKGVNARVVYWENISFSIESGKIGITENNLDIFQQKPDLVICFGWYKNGNKSIYRDVAYSLALYLESIDVKFWNSEMVNQRSVSKLSCLVKLAINNIPITKTKFSLDRSNIIKEMRMPFIAKAAAASRGESNFLVNSSDLISKIMEYDEDFIFQPFVENTHDLRIICFGGNPKLILKRSRKNNSDSHLNNTSQGGQSEWLNLNDIPDEVLELSERICKIMNREMAGIDFIEDKSSYCGYSCLEVNPIPQLTSGVDSDKKINEFADTIKLL